MKGPALELNLLQQHRGKVLLEVFLCCAAVKG